MKKSILIGTVLLVLFGCGASDKEEENSYKIVIGFYNSLYHSSPYNDGSNSGTYLDFIYFENDDQSISVSVSDITGVIYTLPMMEGTKISPDENNSPVLVKEVGGTITEGPPYLCRINSNNPSIKGCYATMTDQVLANFTFSADYEFQINLDIHAIYSSFTPYGGNFEDKIIPISLYIGDFNATNKTIYLCYDIARSKVTQTTNVEFVPEVRVICH